MKLIALMKTYLEFSRKFLQSYVNVFGRSSVTSYIHAFVYHAGYFLDNSNGSIDRYSNFSIENRHQVTKQFFEKSNKKVNYNLLSKCILTTLTQNDWVNRAKSKNSKTIQQYFLSSNLDKDKIDLNYSPDFGGNKNIKIVNLE